MEATEAIAVAFWGFALVGALILNHVLALVPFSILLTDITLWNYNLYWLYILKISTFGEMFSQELLVLQTNK